MSHKAGAICQVADRLIGFLLESPGTDELDIAGILDCFDRVRNHLTANRPLFVCMPCYDRGHRQTECECKGRGWLTQEMVTMRALNKDQRKRVRRNALNRESYRERIELVRDFFAEGDFTLKAVEAAPQRIRNTLKKRIAKNPQGELNPDGIIWRSSTPLRPRAARKPPGRKPSQPESPQSAP